MPKFNLGWLKDKNGEKFAPKTFIKQVLSETGKSLQDILDRKITTPLSAKVGQELIVKDVDENGTPIDWECVERPCYFEEEKVNILVDGYIDFEELSGQHIESAIAYVDGIILKSGNKYNITYNNVLYENLTVVDNYWIGESLEARREYWYNKETYYEYPFYIHVTSSNYITIYLCGERKSRTEYFKIEEIETIYKKLDNHYLEDNVPKINSAEVGQIIVVESVDSHGKPNSFSVKDELNLSSYVKNTQYATSSKAGLVRTSTNYGLTMNGQYIQIYPASTSDISSKSNSSKPLTSNNIDYIVKSGLGNSKLTWTEAEKTKARSVIGAISASDIPDIPEIEPQVQADYEEDNSSSVSYIKNKTHYDTRKLVEINEHINYGGNNAYGNITSDLYALFINKAVDGLLVDGKTISYASEYINNKYGYLIYNLSDNRQLIVNAYSTQAYVMHNESIDGSIYGTLTVTGSVNAGSFKQLDEKYIPDNIPKITTATIGQTLEVESVDEDGAPTKWKAVDKPEVVTTTTDDKGKVVTVDSEGNKILEYPSIISYKYADKIQESNTGVLFCFDTAKPNLGLFSMPNKITTFRVYKDGVYIQGADLKTYNPFIELNVIDCNETRIFVIGKLVSGKVISYFYYFSSNEWSVETQMLPLELLENMFIQRPDEAEVGQILVVKEVDEDGKPTKWKAVDKPSGGVDLGDAGLVEITDGEPTKEGTVMTLNPNAEEVNLYTKEEVDALLQNIPSGGGGNVVNNNLRLLKTIVLTEDVQSVEITEDENGNSFKISEFLIYGNTLATSTNGQLRVNCCENNDDGHSFLPPIASFKGLDTTKRLWLLFSKSMGDGNGKWISVFSTPDSTGRGTAMLNTLKVPQDSNRKMLGDTTSYLRIFSNTSGCLFASGSTFEIWGR